MNKLFLFSFLAMQCCWSQNNKRKMVWEENFNGKVLNESVWNFELGDGCPNICGWGNNEKQLYTKTNHKIKDSKLIISAIKNGNRYTSARITTANKKEFQYGLIETRAKLPLGQGLWPAFWMLGNNIEANGWPECGEIDILEYIGKEPHMVFTSLHSTSSYGNTINTKKTNIPNIEEGFHIYGIDWTSEKIDFLIDKQLVYSYQPAIKNKDTWPYNKPFYFILNLAVGGNFGGPEIDDRILPQQFIIDYIKVYQ